MATLSQCYSNKELREAMGLSTIKTYNAMLDSIYIEDGRNIRDIDYDHVENLKQAIMAGKFIPPLVVRVTEKGLRVADGHHRYHAYIKAIEAGYPVVRVRVEDFNGSEADEISLMLGSAQGRQLSSVDIAEGYIRYIKLGLTIEEVAQKENRSASYVRTHLALADCEEEVRDMVKKKELSHTDALAIQKEYGVKASDVAKSFLDEAKLQGKKKVQLKKFNHKTAYSTLSAEVNNIIDFISKRQSNTDIVNSDDTLNSVLEKLQQTMEIVRDVGWK